MWIMIAAMAAAAGAQGARADLNGMFRAMDRNGDGFVTAAEQPQVPRVTFDGGRGRIGPGRSWISSYDGNGDGRVSRAEFVSRAEAEMAAYRGGR